MPDSWTTLHDLAVVYLALAHGTDAHLSQEELDRMMERLGAWDESLDDDQVRDIVLEAIVAYTERDRDAEVTRAMLGIRSDVSAVERLFALDDLIEIAEADGEVLESEKELISALRRIWALAPSSDG